MRTYGYDYSFAISIDEVNKILIDNLKNVDLELKYCGEDSQSGSTITLDAKFDPWQIIKGGQNSLLRYSMPVEDGYLSIEGPITKSYDLTNVTILIEVTLGWLGSSDRQETQGSKDITKLIFSPTDTKDPKNPGYVAVVNILDPDKQLDTIGLGLLRNYTSNILFENKDKMNYIFADVFPKPKNVSSWLDPYKWIYYYSTGESYDALCFLCTLTDKVLPSNPAFDSAALVKDSNANILISQESFFNNVVLPSVKSTFSGGKFSLSVSVDESCTIKNSEDFNVKTDEGTITADSLKLTTSDDGNGLKTKTSGGGSLKFFFGLAKLPNASYSWSCEDINPLLYTNDQITFSKDKNPVTHHDQSIPWYDWTLLVAVGITSLPGLISVIVDSINDFSDQVNDVGIGNINSNLDKAISNSVVNLANLIDWSTKDGQQFTSNNAGLNGALYVHGNLI
ncbi:TULIP family P47-like protein [Marinifilum sp. N1E240]|uniref:TULIP family P47-like protein n=1 Tax=Marinifilum sp. N1E240 TaxID=2608082 RepID=UPI00128C235D|nr:TULIP family P47-like protein [Marinifilum sp. N1E240]MPQ49268.1 TULIP family P47-like protein [Marinifilum sp. N1E240]